MKTTLMIPEHLVRELKKLAARRGTTLSAVVSEVLRRGLEEPGRGRAVQPLLCYRMGKPHVDVADRDALFRVMEET